MLHMEYSAGFTGDLAISIFKNTITQKGLSVKTIKQKGQLTGTHLEAIML